MTEPNRPRPWLAPREGRLYIVTVLAGVYLFAFRAIPTPPERGARSGPLEDASTEPSSSGRSPSAAVWIDDLPADQRPSVALPAGWRVVSREDAARAASVPRVARAPSSRRLRARTRSS